MNIVLASNDATSSHMLVAIYSVIINNQDSDLNFFILEDGISSHKKELCEKLEDLFHNTSIIFITIDSDLFLSQLVNSRVTYHSYYRYLTPNLLNRKHKALYLDTDTLCLGSIRQFYNTNLSNICIAGAVDTELYKRPGNLAQALGFDIASIPYLNSGVLLMNLTQMRNMHMVEAFRLNLNNRRTLIPKKYDIFNDQTLMNITFKDHALLIDSSYNTLAASLLAHESNSNPVIIHFSGRHKPLTYYDDATEPYMEIYYNRARELEALVNADILHDIIVIAGKRTTSYLD